MKLTFGGKLDRPNVCFLCETTPAMGSKVIDTERYFDGFPHNLQGRRYVCERCINQMLQFFDFASLSQVENAQVEQDRALAIVKGLKQRLDALQKDLAAIAENPNLLMEESVVQPEPEGPALGVGEGTESDTGHSEVDEAGIAAFESEGGSATFRHSEAFGPESEPHFSAYS